MGTAPRLWLWQAGLAALVTHLAMADKLQSIAVTPQLPVVMWHGMGDSCCASYSLGAVKKRIEQVLEGRLAEQLTPPVAVQHAMSCCCHTWV